MAPSPYFPATALIWSGDSKMISGWLGAPPPRCSINDLQPPCPWDYNY